MRLLHDSHAVSDLKLRLHGHLRCKFAERYCCCCCRMYAFDVHCNSYFPLFILLYGKFIVHRIQTVISSHVARFYLLHDLCGTHKLTLLALIITAGLMFAVCCSVSVLDHTSPAHKESVLNYPVCATVCHCSQLLPLPQLPWLQCLAISGSYRGEAAGHAYTREKE